MARLMLGLQIQSITEYTVNKNSLRTKLRIKFWVPASMLIILAIILLYKQELEALPLSLLSNLTSVAAISILVYLVFSDRRHVWSVPATYAIVFSLFHFGATFSLGLGASIPDDLRTIDYWFYNSFTKSAVLLSLIGLLAYAIGACGAAIIRTAPLGTLSNTKQDVYTIRSLQLIGFSLLLVSISIWVSSVISSGGYELLIGSYNDYLNKAKSALTVYINLGIAYGFSFLMIGAQSKLRTRGIIIFGLWVLLAIPIGLRGEVLFPFCTAMVLLGKRGVLPSLKQTVIVFGCLLIVISSARQIRQYGLSNLSDIKIDASPFGALYELGSSLRPVSEVIKWQVYGEDFIYGSSYWAPFDRFLSRAIMDSERLKAEDDQRIMNVLVQSRVGPIGFSPIAEAYRNFGISGVLIIMFLTGLLLGMLDSWAVTPNQLAVTGVIFVQLLIQVRNDFIAIPVQLILGLTVICVASLFSLEIRKNALKSRYTGKTRHSQL
jgi:oligosaccharide repeat unit polymerase